MVHLGCSFTRCFQNWQQIYVLTPLLESLVVLSRPGVMWYFFLSHCHFTLIGSVVVQVHCILVYLCGSIFIQKGFIIQHSSVTVHRFLHKPLSRVFHPHSGESHMWYKTITAVARYAWYLCACVYCSEVSILFCVWWRFPMLESSGLSAVRRGGQGGRVLWAVGLSEGVKDCIRKYGLVFV